MKFTVAIDGPAAAGKGTISKAVAAHFGFAHLDTGLLYRATGRRVLAGEDPIDAAKTLRPEDLDRDDLRSADVAEAASRVAAIHEVRAALVTFQQDFARREGGAVLDGRDLELTGKGADTTLAQVLTDLSARDARDSQRDTAPMKPASDALLLDTTNLSIEAAVEEAVRAVKQKLEQGRG